MEVITHWITKARKEPYKVKFILLEKLDTGKWLCSADPFKYAQPKRGYDITYPRKITINQPLFLTVIEKTTDRKVIIQFFAPGTHLGVDQAVEHYLMATKHS